MNDDANPDRQTIDGQSTGEVDFPGPPPATLWISAVAAAVIIAAGLPWLAGITGGRPTLPVIAMIVLLQGTFIAATIWAIVRSQSLQRFEFQTALRRGGRERNRAEAGRRRSEQSARRVRGIIDQLSRGVVLLDDDRRIEMLNASATRLLRLARVPDAGTPLAEVIRDPQIINAVGGPGDPPRSSRQTIDWVDDTGVRPLQFSIGPVRDDNQLLIEIEDRTEARAVDRIRREFVANVSHELKTPLAAIKGYAETIDLAIEDDLEAARHFVKQIFSQCQRLEDLIATVMQLARAQEGPGNLRIEPIDLAEVLRQAVQTHAPVARGSGLTLIAADDWPATAMTLADREATLTMANNLIGNAVRYTPEGGEIRIELSTELTMQVFKVRDTGIGIEPDEQSRIFERFYRAAATRQSDSQSIAKGTGLGLSIVKNLAISQGGSLGVESQPGRGSTFWVRLPRAVPT